MLSGWCLHFKGITFLFKFGHVVCLTAIPFIIVCCSSQYSVRHARRKAWTSWIINMVFRAVVMETQAVSHIWIIRIRHILNIAFNQKRWLSPKDKSVFPNFFSSVNEYGFIYLVFAVCETNPWFITKLFLYFCV